MESIATLIIIVVVFNLLNMVGRALRGGQARNKAPVETPRDKPGGHFNPFGNYSLKVPAGTGEALADSDFELSGDREDMDESAASGERQDLTAEEWSEPQSPVKPCTPGSPLVTASLRRSLTRKDPLIAAFIFHEILEPPPALRRRRPGLR